MTTMHSLLFVTIFVIILPSSFSVHPGDPFPTDETKSEKPFSEGLLETNDITPPNDNEILTPSSNHISFTGDEEESKNNGISTPIKSNPISLNQKKRVERKTNNQKNSSLSTQKPLLSSKTSDKDVNHSHNPDKKSSSRPETSTPVTVKAVSKNNLIKIGRWKHEESQTKIVRYWYELEGGNMGLGWTFDGYIFQAYDKSEPDTEPVYAFHSEIRSIWTNTLQMNPQPPAVGNDQWISDGVSLYAYKTSMNSTELQPVVRYWNKLQAGATDATQTRIAYLTMNDHKKDQSEWIRGEILFYALPMKD